MRRYHKSSTPNPLGPTAPFYGPFQPPSIERARQLVGGYVAGSAEDREAVAQWIAATGDCVFHAASEVFHFACCCQRCRPDIKRYC
jgi:hypothetical protein